MTPNKTLQSVQVLSSNSIVHNCRAEEMIKELHAKR
jgi:hypothetical protein